MLQYDHLQDRYMHQCWTRSTRTTRIKLRVGSDIYKGWVNAHGLKRGFALTHGFTIWLGLVDKEESRFVWDGTRQAMVKVFTGLQYFESRGCSLFISLFTIITTQTQIKVDWANAPILYYRSEEHTSN